MERVHQPLVYMHSSICETYTGVLVLHRCMVNLEEGVVVSLLWVYVHSGMYENYLV